MNPSAEPRKYDVFRVRVPRSLLWFLRDAVGDHYNILLIERKMGVEAGEDPDVIHYMNVKLRGIKRLLAEIDRTIEEAGAVEDESFWYEDENTNLPDSWKKKEVPGNT